MFTTACLILFPTSRDDKVIFIIYNFKYEGHDRPGQRNREQVVIFRVKVKVALKMITAVETSVTVNNSPIQDYVHPDDHAQPNHEINDSWAQIVYNYL